MLFICNILSQRFFTLWFINQLTLNIFSFNILHQWIDKGTISFTDSTVIRPKKLCNNYFYATLPAQKLIKHTSKTLLQIMARTERALDRANKCIMLLKAFIVYIIFYGQECENEYILATNFFSEGGHLHQIMVRYVLLTKMYVLFYFMLCDHN